MTTARHATSACSNVCQLEHRDVRCKKHLAAHAPEEVCVLQLVHDGTLNLREMQRNPDRLQIVRQLLEHLEPTGINKVGRRAYQQDVLKVRLVSHPTEQKVLNVTRVDEIETFIDTHRQHSRRGSYLMPFDVSEMLGVADTSNDSNMRLTARTDQQHKGDDNADENGDDNGNADSY